jgi:hypothetical protein
MKTNEKVTRILIVDRDRPDAALIDCAASIIRRGGLVAFPTETVYGQAAKPRDWERTQATPAPSPRSSKPKGDRRTIH